MKKLLLLGPLLLSILSIREEVPGQATNAEPLACYGFPSSCNYPEIQCCIDGSWTCCRKGF